MTHLKDSLYSLIPRIRRARGYYLYDFDGNKFIDLFQGNGHNILGHKPFRQTTVLKDIISMGLLFDFPSIYTKRLEKALSALFPEYKSFIIEVSINDALARLAQITGKIILKEEIYDPLFSIKGDERDAYISVWRPFIQQEQNQPPIILPILPFSLSGSPCVICLKNEVKQSEPRPISPFMLAGLTRAIYDLKNYHKPDWQTNDFLAGSLSWKLNCIYIIPQFGDDAYKKVFSNFLSEGFILSPYYPGPSLLPRDISEGEIKKLCRLFHALPCKT
jgi:hypothetical protein